VCKALGEISIVSSKSKDGHGLGNISQGKRRLVPGRESGLASKRIVSEVSNPVLSDKTTTAPGW
jgi:hypothetical protein